MGWHGVCKGMCRRHIHTVKLISDFKESSPHCASVFGIREKAPRASLGRFHYLQSERKKSEDH